MHSDAGGDGGRGVVGVSKPATVEQCHAVIDALAVLLAQLQQTVVALEERLALDSRQSGQLLVSENLTWLPLAPMVFVEF